MIPPTSAWEALTGSPKTVMNQFHRKALASAAMTTPSVTADGSTMPLPMVFATAVVINAPRIFIIAASKTAARGESTFVETTVAMALAASFQPLLISNRTARRMMRIRISSMLQDYPF